LCFPPLFVVEKKKNKSILFFFGGGGGGGSYGMTRQYMISIKCCPESICCLTSTLT